MRASIAFILSSTNGARMNHTREELLLCLWESGATFASLIAPRAL